ncbi:MAG: PIN domain-containing protein [Anaerolineae bacterium]
MSLSSKFVFVDASAWIALFDKYDPYYQRAANFWSELQRQQRRLLTTDYVLDEAYTLVRRGRGGLPMAVALHDLVEKSNVVEIVSIDEKLRQDAWELFVTYTDKVISFTDCTCFALMKQRELFESFSFDADFSRAGFVVRP